MKVITPTDEIIELGLTGTRPTIGITDYSRRVTDAFGVTTVVMRGFSRTMSLRFALPTTNVDAVTRTLAALRSEPAQWIADDRFTWLNIKGFYKDFDASIEVGEKSYCTLTVEGLAEYDPAPDTGGDPAPAGVSSLLLLQPVEITSGLLSASNVPENDHPVWSPTVNYAAGARVIRLDTHRIYESSANNNLGNNPPLSPDRWIDQGPTNRWAMFDQALGTATSWTGSIAVTLDPGPADALALMDVTGTAVRVQTAGYDRTISVGDGPITFLDLPGTGDGIIVTITGDGAGIAAVGTMLVGQMAPLGITSTSAGTGITDYSKKVVDPFGEVTIVPRSWAKRMNVRALIRTDALDLVANRIAAVRAVPSLWVANDGTDSLTIYGFFKEFSIEVDSVSSTLSLSVEGLSEAAPLRPGLPPPSWSDILDNDPAHPKPEDGATVGATQEQLDDIAGAIALMQSAGRLFFRVIPPTADESALGDTWINGDGYFHDRVDTDGLIALGGQVITLDDYPIMLRTGAPIWALAEVQPLHDNILSADQAANLAQMAYDGANTAIDGLIGLADDGKLSVHEKITILIPGVARLEGKWFALYTVATSLEVSTTNAADARENWFDYLDSLSPAWDDINFNTAIVRAEYNDARNDFDDKLFELDEAIKAKQAANTAAAEASAEAARQVAAAALTAANAAATLANDAQATADGKVQSFFQAEPPTAEGAGDLWFDTDDGNRQYRWSGVAWLPVQDGAIGEALLAAAGAQATADGKVTTFYEETPPTAEGVGDLWYQGSIGYLRRWNGTSWVAIATLNNARGDYTAAATYNPGDIVLWTAATGGDGSGYIRIGSGPTTATAPSNATYWTRFVQSGASTNVIWTKSATLPATPAASAGVPAGWYQNSQSLPAGNLPIWVSYGIKTGTNFVWQAPVVSAAADTRLWEAIDQDGKIRDDKVDTGAIVDQAVTIPISAYSAAIQNVTALNTWTVIQSLSFISSGAPVRVDVTLSTEIVTFSTGLQFRIRRGSSVLFQSGGMPVSQNSGGGAGTGNFWLGNFHVTDTPGQGPHTYYLEVHLVGAGRWIEHRGITALETKK